MPSTPTPSHAIVIGNGGHACVLVDALRAAGGITVAGVVSPNRDGAVTALGIPWLADEDDMLRDPTAHLPTGAVSVHIGVGDNFVRQRIQEKFVAADFDFRFPPLVHPSAYIAMDVTLGDGVFVAAGAVIGVSATVEHGALVNVNAVADHHSRVGTFASLAQNVAMGGGAVLGERSAVGIGACVFHATTIGKDTVIEGGSVVNNDVPDQQIWSGIPARPTGQRSPGDAYL